MYIPCIGTIGGYEKLEGHRIFDIWMIAFRSGLTCTFPRRRLCCFSCCLPCLFSCCCCCCRMLLHFCACNAKRFNSIRFVFVFVFALTFVFVFVLAFVCVCVSYLLVFVFVFLCSYSLPSLLLLLSFGT